VRSVNSCAFLLPNVIDRLGNSQMDIAFKGNAENDNRISCITLVNTVFCATIGSKAWIENPNSLWKNSASQWLGSR